MTSTCASIFSCWNVLAFLRPDSSAYIFYRPRHRYHFMHAELRGHYRYLWRLREVKQELESSLEMSNFPEGKCPAPFFQRAVRIWWFFGPVILRVIEYTKCLECRSRIRYFGISINDGRMATTNDDGDSCWCLEEDSGDEIWDSSHGNRNGSWRLCSNVKWRDDLWWFANEEYHVKKSRSSSAVLWCQSIRIGCRTLVYELSDE